MALNERYQADFANASFVGKNRVVFNIGGNSCRLVVVSLLGIGTLYVRFVGTPRQISQDRRDEGLTMQTLKPIRSKTEHARALREIDELIAKAPRKASRAFDRLEALTILVEAYERSHADHRIDERFDPVEAILFHLDRLGKTPKDLETILKCSRSRAWEILQRKRALTLPQIRALVRKLGSGRAPHC